MQAPTPAAHSVRFGAFQLDLRSGELRRNSRRIRLPDQSFRILATLLERPGELVLREELKHKLWPDDTFVDFDHSLNTAVKKLRQALGDDAETPKYIETLPRRGYRFLAPVEKVELAVAPPLWRRRSTWGVAALAPLALLAGYFTWQHFFASPRQPPERVMLAVLPFENLSGDPTQEYLSDGLTEEMITQLGRMRSDVLGVIARTSAMHYKGTKKGTDEIGRELGVDYILEGSVRRADSRVRVSAQLIRVSDQTHLWAESYDRELHDILILQGELARAIAGEIKLKLTPREQAQLTRSSTVNPAAHEAYLKARFYAAQQGGFEQHLHYYQQALEIDPNYALAHAGLAQGYAALGAFESLGIPPREAMVKAKEAALKAVELDPDLEEGHTALGLVKLSYEWDWRAAEREFQRALELQPNSLGALHWYSHLLMTLGRQPESLRLALRGLELDPVNRQMYVHLAWCYLQTRQYDKLLETYQKTIELFPRDRWIYEYLARAYSHQGRHELAIVEAKKAVEVSRNNPYQLATLAYVYAAAGKKSDARALLQQLDAISRKRYVSPYSLAPIHLALADKASALKSLEKAYEDRVGWMAYLKVDPRLDPLRDDPRFQDLLRRMNFPEN